MFKLIFRKNVFYENLGSILVIIYLLGYLASFILFCIKKLNSFYFELEKIYKKKLGDIMDNNENIEKNNILIYNNIDEKNIKRY